MDKIEKFKSVEISTIDIKENDVIVLTFDIDVFDIESCQKVYEVWQDAFPNNAVVCKFTPGMDACVVRDLE